MTFRSFSYCLLVLNGFFFGFAPAVKAQNNISTQRVKGQNGCFTSPELDNLFGVKGKTYAFENLKKYDVKGQNVQLVRMHAETKKEERQLFLLLDETGSWKDTILFKGTENIAFFATLEGNRNAVCIGEFNPEEHHFYIERIYELSAESLLNPTSDQTRITNCPLVYMEKSSRKQVRPTYYDFKYTAISPPQYLFPEKEHLNGTEGFWRLHCGKSLTMMDNGIEGDCFITFDEKTIIDCELSPDPEDSTVFLIAFDKFFLPVADVRNDFERSLEEITENIDREQAIGKITVLSENRLWLEWYGLFDKELSEYRFQLSDFIFYTENNRERPIVLKRCM